MTTHCSSVLLLVAAAAAALALALALPRAADAKHQGCGVLTGALPVAGTSPPGALAFPSGAAAPFAIAVRAAFVRGDLRIREDPFADPFTVSLAIAVDANASADTLPIARAEVDPANFSRIVFAIDPPAGAGGTAVSPAGLWAGVSVLFFGWGVAEAEADAGQPERQRKQAGCPEVDLVLTVSTMLADQATLDADILGTVFCEIPRPICAAFQWTTSTPQTAVPSVAPTTASLPSSGLEGWWVWIQEIDGTSVLDVTDSDMCPRCSNSGGWPPGSNCKNYPSQCIWCTSYGIYRWSFHANGTYTQNENVETSSDFNYEGTWAVSGDIATAPWSDGVVLTTNRTLDFSCAHPHTTDPNVSSMDDTYRIDPPSVVHWRVRQDAQGYLHVSGQRFRWSGSYSGTPPLAKDVTQWTVFRPISKADFHDRYFIAQCQECASITNCGGCSCTCWSGCVNHMYPVCTKRSPEADDDNEAHAEVV